MAEWDVVIVGAGSAGAALAYRLSEDSRRRILLCLGILGTRYLMEGPVYASKLAAKDIRYEIPDGETRRAINDIILRELVAGRFEDRARQYFRHTIRGLGKRGCDAVVLGCTEIPLLVSEADSPLPALDSTRILARAALREATR